MSDQCPLNLNYWELNLMKCLSHFADVKGQCVACIGFTATKFRMALGPIWPLHWGPGSPISWIVKSSNHCWVPKYVKSHLHWAHLSHLCANCLQLPSPFQIILIMINCNFPISRRLEWWTLYFITLVQMHNGAHSVLKIALSVSAQTSTQCLSLICHCPNFSLTYSLTQTLVITSCSCQLSLCPGLHCSVMCSQVLLLSAMRHRGVLAFHRHLSFVAFVYLKWHCS